MTLLSHNWSTKKRILSTNFLLLCTKAITKSCSQWTKMEICLFYVSPKSLSLKYVVYTFDLNVPQRHLSKRFAYQPAALFVFGRNFTRQELSDMKLDHQSHGLKRSFSLYLCFLNTPRWAESLPCAPTIILCVATILKQHCPVAIDCNLWSHDSILLKVKLSFLWVILTHQWKGNTLSYTQWILVLHVSVSENKIT